MHGIRIYEANTQEDMVKIWFYSFFWYIVLQRLNGLHVTAKLQMSLRFFFEILKVLGWIMKLIII